MSDSVKRYDMRNDYGYCGCGMDEAIDGDYVSYEDYETLATRLATLDAERAGVVELKEWRVVTRDGKSVNAISYTVERSAQIDCHGYDSDFPADAPHRVTRVCLTPTTPEADHA